jgi:hypothetical protein
VYYIVEIHDTENDKVGILTEKNTGEISKFSTFSQANVQAALLKKNLTEHMYTKVVSINKSASFEEQ